MKVRFKIMKEVTNTYININASLNKIADLKRDIINELSALDKLGLADSRMNHLYAILKDVITLDTYTMKSLLIDDFKDLKMKGCEK